MMSGRDTNMFLSGVDKSFLCSICRGVLTDPQETPCGHEFCKGCIQLYLLKAGKCPLDKTPLSEKDLRRSSFIVRDFLGKLRTRCDHYNEGCEWIDIWSSLESHLGKCDCAVISCVHRPCTAQSPRKYMAAHTDICGFVKLPCKYCKREVARSNVESHYSVCDAYPMRCDCREIVRRKDLAMHRDVCIQKNAPCLYDRFGCKQIVKMKDMEQHLKDGAHSHLELVTGYIIKMEAKQLSHIENMEKQHASDMAVLKRKYQSQQISLKEDIETLKKELNSLKLGGLEQLAIGFSRYMGSIFSGIRCFFSSPENVLPGN